MTVNKKCSIARVELNPINVSVLINFSSCFVDFFFNWSYLKYFLKFSLILLMHKPSQAISLKALSTSITSRDVLETLQQFLETLCIPQFVHFCPVLQESSSTRLAELERDCSSDADNFFLFSRLLISLITSVDGLTIHWFLR